MEAPFFTCPPVRGPGRHAPLLLLVLICACGGGEADPVEPGPPEPIQLEIGTTVGQPTFPMGSTAQGGRGQTVSGIPCKIEAIAYHVHSHVALFVNGTQRAIPMAIGIVDPVLADGRFAVRGTCFYWIHTHDATGIVHVEPPTNVVLTLGQFFDIWGQPLSRTSIAGFSGAVTIHVDGARYDGDPRAIPLGAHTLVTLQVGAPVVQPPVYLFPPGY